MPDCLCGGICERVRMLCNLSANLTIITRTSSVMARNICRRSSAFTSSTESVSFLYFNFPSLDTLVSPSTIRRTVGPNSSSILSKVTTSVSSTVSCNNPAAIDSQSNSSSPKIRATSTG
uniref:GTP pyrophosphokinase n=1 Tax=Rhizophora mucronata TaxID=61149 RepID=A0A2P2MT83_RHIMU